MMVDEFWDVCYFFNVLFNIMCGGIFDYYYYIEKVDLSFYLVKVNRIVFKVVQLMFFDLLDIFLFSELCWAV